MKKCSKCKELKEEKDFYWRDKNKSKRRSECRDCSHAYRREYYKRWYPRHRERLIEERALRKRKLRNWLVQYKINRGCKLCPEIHPACLEFHHREPRKKKINIAYAITAGWEKKQILKEIRKCDILCVNCHRKIHFSLSPQEVKW